MKKGCLASVVLIFYMVVVSCTRSDNSASDVSDDKKVSNKILIAAASDLKFALDSLIAVFENSHAANNIDITYGSSGKLYEQIHHDAPFDLFFSADIEYPLLLKSKGLCISDVEIYGRGRLVLWSYAVDPNVEEINTLVLKSIKKIAIANPRHAPYGKRAVEVLNYYGLGTVTSKIVYGENISQAAQFVTAGGADAGIIALSLAMSPVMQARGKYFLIPEESHKPLDQGFVILNHAKDNPLATAFGEFVTSITAASILRHYGFQKNRTTNQ